MAVRNGQPFLTTAIDSVLAQTYLDFRFLIVDDDSTDDTREVVRSYSDDRIELLCLDRNVGQTAALTIGLDRISTPWMARMDADDSSAPTRLEEQMRALDSNPSIGCVGTWAWAFSEDPHVPESLLVRPEMHAVIQQVLLRESPLIHGTIMVSVGAVKESGGYEHSYHYSADLDLYDRLLLHCEATNVPKPLMGLRRHPGQGSLSKKAVDESLRIFQRRLSDPRYSGEEIRILKASNAVWQLRRAYDSANERRYPLMAASLIRAIRLSPTTILNYLSSETERQRRSLKEWGFGERPWEESDATVLPDP